MSLEAGLDLAFQQFISHTLSDDLLIGIKDSVTPADIDILMRKIESLDDPSAYCKNDWDRETPAGFFLFIDFVSALIIDMGDSAIQEASNYSDIEHPFVPWVIQYTNDERFHNEIMSKFSTIFTD